MNKTYAADGVNIAVGDDFSSFAARICRSTWEVSPFVRVREYGREHFRGVRTFELTGLPAGYTFDLAPDGAGTKTVMTSVALSHHQAAYDVAAMGCGDITRHGGLPLVFTNVLDVAALGLPGSHTYRKLTEVIVGLGVVAREQEVVMYKGETAELGPCIGSEDPEAVTKFNWAGVAFGVYHPKKMITGETLAAGQVVIALREHGFRSNGMSSVRAAFRKKFGAEWWKHPRVRQEYARAAAVPSKLYDRFLTTMNGWRNPGFTPHVRMHAIAHISGGGIPDKFGRDILFPRGFSAELDDLWDPPPIMQLCAAWRGTPDEPMSDFDCYSTWNGGQGVLVVVDEVNARAFIRTAHDYHIDAKVCGRVTESSAHPELIVHSKFAQGSHLAWGA